MSGTVQHVGCKIEGCDRPHRSLGLCSIHYTRQHRHGSPHILNGPSKNERPATKLQPGQRVQDAVSSGPSYGTITLEEWKRHRASSAADVHVVQHQRHATGVTT